MSKGPVKIIFISSDVSLSHPLPKIKDEIKNARDTVLRDAWRKRWIDIVERPYFEFATLQNELNADPDREMVIHYAGHAGAQGLLIKTNAGEQVLPVDDLVTLLSAHRQRIRLVFLNGCYSQEIAKKLCNEGIRFVIGTTGKIGDSVAARVALEFYLEMISTPKTVDQAFAICKASFTQAGIGDELHNAFRGFDKEATADFPWQLTNAEPLAPDDLAWTLVPARKRNLALSGEYGRRFRLKVLCLYAKPESDYFQYLLNNLKDDTSNNWIINGLWNIFGDLDREDLENELKAADIIIHLINGSSYVGLIDELIQSGINTDDFNTKKHICFPVDAIPSAPTIRNSGWYQTALTIIPNIDAFGSNFKNMKQLIGGTMSDDRIFETFFKSNIEKLLKEILNNKYIDPDRLAKDLKQMRFMEEEAVYSKGGKRESNIHFILIEGTNDCAQPLLVWNIINKLNNLKNKKSNAIRLRFRTDLNTEGEFWTLLFKELQIKRTVSTDQYSSACIDTLLQRMEHEDIVLVIEDLNSTHTGIFKKVIQEEFLQKINIEYKININKNGSQFLPGRLFIFAVNYDVEKAAYSTNYTQLKDAAISEVLISPVTLFNNTERDNLFQEMKKNYCNNLPFQTLDSKENQDTVIDKPRKTAIQLICEKLQCDFNLICPKVLNYD